jgi:hypothetical protein
MSKAIREHGLKESSLEVKFNAAAGLNLAVEEHPLPRIPVVDERVPQAKAIRDVA